MKIFRIFEILLFALSPANRFKIIPAFNKIMIGPLAYHKETNIIVETSRTYLNFVIYIVNDKYKNGIEILSETITTKGKYTYTYQNTYTRSSNQIYIKYKTKATNEYSETERYTFNVSSASSAYFSDDNPITTRSSIGVIHSDLSFTSENITYEFSGFTDVFAPSIFHKICLNDFRILVNKNYRDFIKSGDIYLALDNVNGTFDEISGVQDRVYFDLDLIPDSTGFTFELKHTYYVDPVSYKMSSDPKTGYVLTNNIFLPIKESSEPLSFNVMLGINDFGIDRDYLIYKATAKVFDNPLGNCYNSAYCVVKEYK